MNEDRPFFRVYHFTKQQAAAQQIEAAIAAFSEGKFAVTITLAAAAESMSSEKEGPLWSAIRDHPDRPVEDVKQWISRLNETRDWLKHDRPQPTVNLVAFEAGLFILRAMSKWEPWTPAMLAFHDLWFSSPKLMRPKDYAPETESPPS